MLAGLSNFKFLWLLVLALFLTLISQSVSALPLSDLPGWQVDHQSQAIPALLNTCYKKNTTGSFKSFCNQLKANPNLSDLETRKLLETYFVAIPVTNHGNPNGLFTGYYEPSFDGSLVKTSEYSVPLYAPPKGLIKTNIDGKPTYRLRQNGIYQPLPDRAVITSKGLPNTPVLAWIHSNIDQFFLQIQGSGEINLNNGQEILVGYAAENGKKYFPIGAYLIKTGALNPENVSMQTIKNWLEGHPSMAQMVMNLNPSYVFFRRLKTDQPIGAEGVELTPYRSLAVDRKYTALGTPVWLSTSLPTSKQTQPFNHLLVAQDIGGAIKGPVRGDIYFGSGSQPEWLAGHMQSTGNLWIFTPKT